MFDDDRNFALSPINYFQISTDCLFAPPVKDNSFPLTSANFKKYKLPDTSALCNEEHFAELSLGWNAAGIAAFVTVDNAFHLATYPDVSQGDSIELFIDTRDVKTSGFNTKFCHHFFFLPESVEGHQAGEITRFRTEDLHELCDPHALRVKGQLKSSSYNLQIFIPTECLHGYDPEQFDRLGFSYRINRSGKAPQHFSVTTDEFQIEQQPSLWSSLKLIK
jgi:hypothetical protein